MLSPWEFRSSAPEQSDLSPCLPHRCSPLNTPPLVSPRPMPIRTMSPPSILTPPLITPRTYSRPTSPLSMEMCSIRRVCSGKFPPPPPPLYIVHSDACGDVSSPSLTPPLVTTRCPSSPLITPRLTPPLETHRKGSLVPYPTSIPHPDPYEEETEFRTPPISPPWTNNSSSSLTFDSSLASTSTGDSSLGESPPPTFKELKEKRRSRRASFTKRKSRLQRKKVDKKGEERTSGKDLEDISSPTFTSSSASTLTMTSSFPSEERTASSATLTSPTQENKVFLSTLPESEALFFSLPPPKKKQEKIEGGVVTISSLRDALGKEEEEQRAKGHLELRGATPLVLLSYLCSPLATKKFISTFLLTFPTFMSSFDLFDGLTLAVEKAGEGGGEGCGEEVRKRVRGIFLQWMTRFFQEDWTKELQEKFRAFLQTEAGGLLEEGLPTRSPPLSPEPRKPSLRAHMKACAEVCRPTPPRQSSCPSLVSSKVTKKGGDQQRRERRSGSDGIEETGMNGMMTTIDMFEDEEIAETLSSYSYSLFSSFREREFLPNIKKNKKNNDDDNSPPSSPRSSSPSLETKPQEPSPLTQLINLFNHLSMWVTSEIVSRPKLSERLFLLEKFTHIAHLLHHQHHNHHLAFALLSGLTKSCIKNMPTTLSSLPPSPLDTLETLEGIFSPANNFKSYRAVVETSTPPCLPYLGLFFQDLVFLNDGNPNYIKGEGAGEGEGLINFGKWSRISEVVFDVTLCRYEGGGRGGAGKEMNDRFLWWVMNEAVVLEEKEQYRWARRVDPKDTEGVIAEFLRGERDSSRKVNDLERQLREEKERAEEKEKEYLRKIEELQEELKKNRRRSRSGSGSGIAVVKK